ncbi:MAG: hypothetical protein ACFCUJ_06295 [Thiotrichales bacterium]
MCGISPVYLREKSRAAGYRAGIQRPRGRGVSAVSGGVGRVIFGGAAPGAWRTCTVSASFRSVVAYHAVSASGVA